MKFVTYVFDGAEFAGVMNADNTAVIPTSEFGISAKTVNELICELDGKLPVVPENAKCIALSEVELLAPIPHPVQDVICLGLNYADHATEAAAAFDNFKLKKGEACYFSKHVFCAVAPDGEIDGHFDICDSLDYEVELAVILGKDAYKVKAEDADNYIFGYTILNDVSARNLQTKHNQWFFGKSLDGFTPIGPWIVSADEIGIKQPLGIRCYVNGEERQNGSTANLIFDIPYIIEELSSGMTLPAGTIISTGTPEGVGMKTGKYLKSGDVVRCEIDEIGVLENTVV